MNLVKVTDSVFDMDPGICILESRRLEHSVEYAHLPPIHFGARNGTEQDNMCLGRTKLATISIIEGANFSCSEEEGWSKRH